MITLYLSNFLIYSQMEQRLERVGMEKEGREGEAERVGEVERNREAERSREAERNREAEGEGEAKRGEEVDQLRDGNNLNTSRSSRSINSIHMLIHRVVL